MMMMQQARIIGRRAMVRVPCLQQNVAPQAGKVRFLSEGGDRLHSTDIAFKPAESGWGGGAGKYSDSFDRIFGKKKEEEETTTTNTTKSEEQPTK